MCFLHCKKLLHDNHGSSLIEVVIAATILVIALLPLINLINGLLVGIQNRKKEFQTTIIAENLMETIKQKKWDEKSTDPPTYLPASKKTANLGPEGSEYFPNFDDIDDFNGYTRTVGNVICTVTIKYVNVKLNAAVTDSSIPTDYKKITVCANTGGASNKNIFIKTISENIGGPYKPEFKGYSLYYLAKKYKDYGSVSWDPLVDDNLVVANDKTCIYSTTDGAWIPSPTRTQTLRLDVVGEKNTKGKDPRTGFQVKYRVWSDIEVEVKTKTWGETGGYDMFYRGSWWGSPPVYAVRMDRTDTFQRQSDTIILINGIAQTINIGDSYQIESVNWSPGDNGSAYSELNVINVSSTFFDIHQEVWEYDEEYDSAHVRIESYIEKP